MNDNTPFDSDYTRAPRPTTVPKTPQEYYDFLKVDIMYEGESEEEYFSRMNILENINAKIDANERKINPPLIDRLIIHSGYAKRKD